MYSMKKYLLLFLCLTLGVAYAQDTLRVRVMTYNLRFGELASLEELAHHIKSFKPDFVALQEVDSKTDRKRTPHQKGKDFISELAYHTGMFGRSEERCLGFTEKRLTILPVITVLGC